MTMADDRKLELFGEVAADGWEHDVWLMARRMALLYHYMAREIVDRLGEEEGRKLIKDAVWKYGVHCGKTVKEGVEKMGLPLTKENFRKVPDLPSRGWRHRVVDLPDGKKQTQSYLCPLARAWQELDDDLSLDRIYCFVDQSKTEGYNGCDLECIHAHNVLDGDAFCEVVMREKE
jgi:hypothetical protein